MLVRKDHLILIGASYMGQRRWNADDPASLKSCSPWRYDEHLHADKELAGLGFVFYLPPLGPPFFGVSCPGAQANEEASLILLEQNWAQALELHNSETVSCILADEFEDADVNGQVHNARCVSGHRFSDAEEQLTAPPLGAGLVLYAECFVEERNLGRSSFLNCSEGCSQCEP